MWIHRILRKMQRRRTALDIEDQSLLSPSTFLSEYLLLLLLRLMDHGNSIHQSMLFLISLFSLLLILLFPISVINLKSGKMGAALFMNRLALIPQRS